MIDVALPANYEPDVLGLANLTAAEAITQLCSGRITAVQYATALLGEAQRWECINAWSALNVERVAGPLCYKLIGNVGLRGSLQKLGN